MLEAMTGEPVGPTIEAGKQAAAYGGKPQDMDYEAATIIADRQAPARGQHARRRAFWKFVLYRSDDPDYRESANQSENVRRASLLLQPRRRISFVKEIAGSPAEAGQSAGTIDARLFDARKAVRCRLRCALRRPAATLDQAAWNSVLMMRPCKPLIRRATPLLAGHNLGARRGAHSARHNRCRRRRPAIRCGPKRRRLQPPP